MAFVTPNAHPLYSNEGTSALRGPRREPPTISGAPTSPLRRQRVHSTLAPPARREGSPSSVAGGRTKEIALIPVVALGGEADYLDALQASAREGVLMVVKVYAPWCRSCRALEPKYNRLAREYGDVAQFYELNLKENRLLCARLNVTAMPTFLIYDGELGLVNLFTCGPKRAHVLREEFLVAVEAHEQRVLVGGGEGDARKEHAVEAENADDLLSECETECAIPL